jgi:hypothetical protein
MGNDPRDIFNNNPMSSWQIATVAITVELNALDGFDGLSISFATTGIAKDWGIDRAALGIVLSMELLGTCSPDCYHSEDESCHYLADG